MLLYYVPYIIYVIEFTGKWVLLFVLFRWRNQ